MGNRVPRGETEPTPTALDVPEMAVTEASPPPAEGYAFFPPAQVDSGPVDGWQGPEQDTGDQNRDVLQQTVRSGEDSESVSGSEAGDTPRGSRRHVIQAMMDSSPQVSRSGELRPLGRRDSDAASMAEEDQTPATLEPLEHEWMMRASDGDWAGLRRLLSADPTLVLRKDFVTGFTCLHWSAKRGQAELLALIVDFSRQNGVPLSVDVRSSAGYTPLHVAAMHGHMEVVKLLVGAFDADVEARDFSGRKACRYLTAGASVDIRDIIGAYEQSQSRETERRDRRRWRPSKFRKSLNNPGGPLEDEDEEEDQPGGVALRRTSSLYRMKPSLDKLRKRTSKLVHSVSLRDRDHLDGAFKPRWKKTHFLD